MSLIGEDNTCRSLQDLCGSDVLLVCQPFGGLLLCAEVCSRRHFTGYVSSLDQLLEDSISDEKYASALGPRLKHLKTSLGGLRRVYDSDFEVLRSVRAPYLDLSGPILQQTRRAKDQSTERERVFRQRFVQCDDLTGFHYCDEEADSEKCQYEGDRKSETVVLKDRNLRCACLA